MMSWRCSLVRAATRQWARRVHQENRWDGVRWWSHHHPAWRLVGYWAAEPPDLIDVTRLDLAHPAVTDAARVLNRTFLPNGTAAE